MRLQQRVFAVLTSVAVAGWLFARFGWHRGDLLEAEGISSERFRELFDAEYEKLAANASAVGNIFGVTLDTLKLDVEVLDRIRHPESLGAKDIKVEFSNRTAKVYNPYPKWESQTWKSRNIAPYVECQGPWNESTVTAEVEVFLGRPNKFAVPPIGSYDLLDIDDGVCFERQTRLGPYGYGNRNGSEGGIEWDSVNWAALQEQCVRRNVDRFNMNPRSDGTTPPTSVLENLFNWLFDPEKAGSKEEFKERATERTAIVIRSYLDKAYTENDKQYVRSVINELSLRTGGEYQVFLLIGVKNTKLPIMKSDAAYLKTLEEFVPPEFHGLSVLWNVDVIKESYPKIADFAADSRKSYWLPLQHFARKNPTFDFYWSWELDTRYTGHHYDLLPAIERFTLHQPRRDLWERNERFYIPSIHGPYDTTFRRITESIADTHDGIWGPYEQPEVEAQGPIPGLHDPKGDFGYKWGLAEHADFTSLAPILNPVNTSWEGRNQVWGYSSQSNLERRATFSSMSRLSKRLLDLMHTESVHGRHLASAMGPATVALMHGLKVVHAPVPVFFDRDWTKRWLNLWLNPGKGGVAGSSRESPVGKERERRWKGVTVAPLGVAEGVGGRLYRNWLGLEEEGIGGKDWEEIHGRMCLPPMLLYPVGDTSE